MRFSAASAGVSTVVLWFFLMLMLPALGSAQPAANGAAPSLEEIRTALAEGDPAEAWRRVLALDETAPEELAANNQLVAEVARAITTRMDAEMRTRPEQVVLLGTLLLSDRSVSFIQKAFPTFRDTILADLRMKSAEAYFRLGIAATAAARPQEAEPNLRRAAELAPPTSETALRAHLSLAQIIIERANAFLARQDPTSAIPLWDEAMTHLLAVRENSSPNSEAGASARSMIRVLVNSGLKFELPGVPTMTPTPTPTPVPGFMESVLGTERGFAVRDFFKRARTDSNLQGELILWAVIIVGVIVVYWVIPLMTLGALENRGDVLAFEWKVRARWLGIFALIGYMASRMKGSMGSKATGSSKSTSQPCPHCGFALENMFSYEDLVFSKCPKCRNKIAPLFTVESFIQTVANSMATEAEKINIGAISLESAAKERGIQRLAQAIITLGVRRRASDLHIEPDERGLLVRQRVDGIMTEMFNLPRSLALSLVSSIKVQANLDISEKRVPQDGKFQVRIDNTDVDMRVATSPTTTGEKASLRLLDIRSIQMSPRHLGMSEVNEQTFEKVIQQPHGMVLITGPTGSGKTTTIYVALQSLANGDKNIISIEDPIEFRIHGVNQIQVNPVAGLTFAGGLRSILRQDPDIIVVGEIRDKETAEISVNAVLTGHLVFSTLHTVDAAASVARLIDLGVSPRQFADALSLVVAQRLIRLVCNYCKQPYTPNEESLNELGLQLPLPAYDFQKGQGCQVCNQSGFFRRTGIFEMLTPSDRLRIELESGTLSTGQIREIAVQGGMRTLRSQALTLLKEGRTTVEETVRVTK